MLILMGCMKEEDGRCGAKSNLTSESPLDGARAFRGHVILSRTEWKITFLSVEFYILRYRIATRLGFF